jgi:hypothetical protein
LKNTFARLDLIPRILQCLAVYFWTFETSHVAQDLSLRTPTTFPFSSKLLYVRARRRDPFDFTLRDYAIYLDPILIS